MKKIDKKLLTVLILASVAFFLMIVFSFIPSGEKTSEYDINKEEQVTLLLPDSYYRLPDVVAINENNDNRDEKIISKIIEISGNKTSEDDAKIILSEVRDCSERFSLSESLILGIIAQESHFVYTAMSRKGATGLMQIMPIALEDYNKHNSITYSSSDLWYFDVNIEIGCWNLNRQKRYIHSNDISDWIISYNSGSTNFKKNKENYRKKYAYLDNVEKYRKIFENI